MKDRNRRPHVEVPKQYPQPQPKQPIPTAVEEELKRQKPDSSEIRRRLGPF